MKNIKMVTVCITKIEKITRKTKIENTLKHRIINNAYNLFYL